MIIINQSINQSMYLSHDVPAQDDLDGEEVEIPQYLNGYPEFPQASGESLSCHTELVCRAQVLCSSNTCTLASRMPSREQPCGRSRSRYLTPPCLPLCFLRCTDGCRDDLACTCGWDRKVSCCLSSPPFPLCLLWSQHLKTLTGQVAESAGGELTKGWVDQFPISMSDLQAHATTSNSYHKKNNFRSIISINLAELKERRLNWSAPLCWAPISIHYTWLRLFVYLVF